MSLIKSQRILLEIPDITKRFLNLLINSLFDQKIKESKILKIKNKKEMKINFFNKDCNYESESGSESENENNEKEIDENKNDNEFNIFVDKIYFENNDYNEYENEDLNEEIKVKFYFYHNLIFNQIDIQEIVERFINPFGKLDEYETFKQLVFYLKKDYDNFFENYLKDLNHEKLNNIKDLCYTVRVNVLDENQKEINVPRKILKVRKTNMDIQKYNNTIFIFYLRIKNFFIIN